MKQILLTLIFAVVNTWSAWALDFCFRHLNTSNGLPNQQVEAIVQDADGYIWIGTRNGLAKFDGYNVQTYYHQEGMAHSLIPSNPQPIGFSGILLAKRQNSFYCTYFLHNRNVADTKSPYPIKRLEVIRWFNQKSMVFNQSLS